MDNNSSPDHEDDEPESPPRDNGATSSETPVKKPGSKGVGRKRTKSGCLTCRKRRIKCGEERPTCQNCTKSKRKCEGYNQRVVFKDPMSTYRPTWAGTSEMVFSSRGGPHRANSKKQTPNNPPVIAPKPAGSMKDTAPPSKSSRPLEFVHDGYPRTNEHQHHGPAQTSANYQVPPPRSQNHNFIPSPTDPSVRPQAVQLQSHSHQPQYQPSHYDFQNLQKLETGFPVSAHGQLSPSEWEALQSSNSQHSGNEIYVEPSKRFLTQTYATSNWDIGTSFSEVPHPQAAGHDDHASLIRHEEAKSSQHSPVAMMESQTSSDQYELIDEDEDDPWDVSDDEMMIDGESQLDHLRHNDLGAVVALQAAQHDRGLQMRSMLDFIDRPDMLATYAPSIQSSPLRDPMAARLFCHFVNVTAPIISMYERHPANPSVIFQGSPVPKSQQHIWTYVYPTLALRNSALLHAMLALASLHVSQLQNVPVTKSLKHYHISLRRVAKSLGNDAQRTKPAILAAAMLLGFYELWCADHQKWSNHLLGSKHLLVQINFAKIAKFVKLEKLRKREEERAQELERRRQSGSTYIDERAHFQTYLEDVDENLVGMLMGKRLRYDEFGHVLDDDDGSNADDETFTEKDIANYEIQRDIFWWYAKQDVYQSILGGGRLFLPYDLWSRCPPRAPIGRLNATYGTYDHLIILMARVADFASKDLVRKRKAAKAQGGWRPPPGMGPPGPPQGQSGHPGAAAGPPSNMRAPPTMPGGRGGPPGHTRPPQMQHGPPPGGLPRGPPQMPTFPGMLPTFGEAKLPMGFDRQYRERTPPSATSPTSTDDDLEAQRIEAQEEWEEIRSMFTVLVEHFGEDYQPLGPEYTTPIQTPFGPALQYRTYGIAGIWMGYYMGLIACHRAHPSMPPAAMMAAGIAARQTGHMANEIGRIAAGIAPEINDTTKHVSPLIGAGLIESAAPLFIAAVQYQDPTQRLWTVTRLVNIARLSGWQTANAIAKGCETSWVKTGEAGMGPPWVRKVVEKNEREENGEKESIWSSGRRVDRAGQDRDYEGALVVARTDRVYYALGVLGLEKDFDRLEVGQKSGV